MKSNLRFTDIAVLSIGIGFGWKVGVSTLGFWWGLHYAVFWPFILGSRMADWLIR